MTSNTNGATEEEHSETEFMKQLEIDTQKLVTSFGAGSVSEIPEKPNYRWLL